MFGTTSTIAAHSQHVVFTDIRDAEEIVAQLKECAEEGEEYNIIPFQGGRFHIEILFNGVREGYF